MYPQRKFIANERSLPKQANRASYQQLPSKNIVGDNQFKNPYYAQHSSKKIDQKQYSDSQVRPKQQYFKNLNQRRKNEGQMSSLKNQLQNLKNQVNKLINKQPGPKTPKKQRPLIHQDIKSDKKVNYVSKKFQDQFQNQNEDFNDTASMSSVTTEKVLNEPLRKLEKKVSSQHFDHNYYMQLENDLLKTEIKNLKNKYVSKKRQLIQKCQLMQKKIQFLEVNLQKSEQSLIECRKALETEIMIIKKQITQKSQAKNEIQVPSSDKIDIEGNDLLKDKIKRLYDQLNEKTKQINNLNIQNGDLSAMLDRKKFDLKKETQKSLELSKQIQFSRRQMSRTQQYLQTQLGKRKQLQKQNQILKEKNQNLMNQLYTKEQIVTGSEQYQSRLAQQIEQYKKKEDELQLKLSSLRQQNKKYKQLSQSDKDQITYLRKNNEETMSKINQLSRRLKQEQQKSLDKQDYYRKMIDLNKQKQEQKIKMIKQEYETATLAICEQKNQKEEQINGQSSEAIRQKDRQINKWKAQYKILKIKYEEKNSTQTRKKEEIDQYYRGYVQYKHQNQLFTERIKLLQKSIQKYLQKIGQKQAQIMRNQVQYNKKLQGLASQIIVLKRQVNAAQQESLQSKSRLAQTIYKFDQQTKYRQQIQTKIQKFIQKQLHPEQFEDSDEEDSGLQQQQGYGRQLSQQIKASKIQIQEDECDQLYDQAQLQAKLQTQQRNKRTLKKSKTQCLNKNNVVLSQSERIQLEELSQTITKMKKRILEQDEKISKNVRDFKNKDMQIKKLKSEVRELLETHQKQITEIRDKYIQQKVEINIKKSFEVNSSLKDLFQQEILIEKQRYAKILLQSTEMKRQIDELQRQLIDHRQETKSLSHLYNVKNVDMEDLIQKSNQDRLNSEKKIQDFRILKNQKESNLMNEISLLKDEINSLRLEVKKLNAINSKIQHGSFDQALKNQIESNKTLREQNNKKNQQIYRLRDTYTTVRSQYDNLRSELQVEKLKGISQRKNIEVAYQIQQQNFKNKLAVEQKKTSSLEQKIMLVIEQNKKKDSFIQSYIMGKKLPASQKQFVSQFVRQYEIQMSGKAINEKLKADSHELEKMIVYNYNLLKDMAEMKQKMLLYETLDGQISIYESKHSGQQRDNDFDFSPIQQKTNQSPKTPNRRFKKMLSLVDPQIQIQREFSKTPTR